MVSNVQKQSRRRFCQRMSPLWHTSLFSPPPVCSRLAPCHEPDSPSVASHLRLAVGAAGGAAALGAALLAMPFAGAAAAAAAAVLGSLVVRKRWLAHRRRKSSLAHNQRRRGASVKKSVSFREPESSAHHHGSHRGRELAAMNALGDLPEPTVRAVPPASYTHLPLVCLVLLQNGWLLSPMLVRMFKYLCTQLPSPGTHAWDDTRNILAFSFQYPTHGRATIWRSWVRECWGAVCTSCSPPGAGACTYTSASTPARF